MSTEVLFKPDEVLNSRLEAAGKLTAPNYRLLRLSERKLVEKQLGFVMTRGETSPDLTPDVDLDSLNEKEETLLNIKADLLANVPDGPMKRAYRWKINESIALVRMTRAASTGDQRRFKRYGEFAYGKPNYEVFAACNKYFADMAGQFVNSDNENLAEAAKNVLTVLPELDDASAPQLLPSQELFDYVKAQHQPFIEAILAGVEIPDTGFANFQEADNQTSTIMDNLGVQDYEIVDQDSGVATWDVDNRERLVRRPTTNTKVTRERYIGLVALHELGTHISEYINGKQQPLIIIGSGLDRNAGAGEGKSTIREQIAYETPQGMADVVRFQELLRRHYSISLGYGLTGEEMSFAEVFKVVNAIDTLWERIQNPNNKDAEKIAVYRTWKLLTQRTLKGTDGQGGAYLKDKIYLEANLRYWQLAAEHPELTKYWNIGNVDLTNPRHIELLIGLGIISENDIK